MLPEAPPNRGASIFQSSVSKIVSLWPYRTAIERSLSDRSSAAITADDSMETGDTNKEVHMEDRRQQREFRAIDETEISDFNVVLREQGFDRDDFELAEELDEPRRAAIEGLIITIAQVTVTRKKNAVSRSYRAGDDGIAWVADFEKELRAGVFR